MKPDLEHMLNEVIKIARRTGEYIRYEGNRFNRDKIEKKGLNNLVSYVDKEAERLIVQTLRFTFNEAGFITEEGTDTEQSDEYNWVIDPLDGTTNFMHGLPVYSISIALLHQNKPVLGVIYEINRDECFYAIEGGKAYCNRREIRVSSVSRLQDGLFITGIPYTDFDSIPEYFEILKDFMKGSHGIRRLGSAAADLAYVACGRAEGFFEHDLHAWDVAAGILLVKQAGGIVTDYQGSDDYLFGGELIAGSAVQPEMLQIIRKHWKRKKVV
jgi:myo-inositol-1(or 4)-monophosphatase